MLVELFIIVSLLLQALNKIEYLYQCKGPRTHIVVRFTYFIGACVVARSELKSDNLDQLSIADTRGVDY